MTRRTRRAAGVDPTDAIPLYHQIYLALRDDIVSGRFAHGTFVPTEAALSDRYQVSRITARRAVEELASQGLVERRRRTGTKVTYRELTQPIEGSIEQAVETLIAFGRKTRVEVSSITREPAGANATDLGLARDAVVVRVVRIRFLDGEPLGEVVLHAPARLAKLFTRARLKSSPALEILRERGHAIGQARQTILAELADPELATLLAILPRSPILTVRRVVHAVDGTPLMCTVARYRGDRYRVSLDLQP